MVTDRMCSVPGCSNTHYALGWCNKHWQRHRTYGDPLGSAERRKPTIEARFWSKVDFDPHDEQRCWPWLATMNPLGYGQFSIEGHTAGAHRVAYELEVGPIPEGLQLDHLCRNPRCVNPTHLEPVTNAVNTRRGLAGYALREVCKAGLHDITIAGNRLPIAGGRHTCRPCKEESARKSRARKQLLLTVRAG